MIWIVVDEPPARHIASRTPPYSTSDPASLAIVKKIVGLTCHADRHGSGGLWEVHFGTSEGRRFDASAETFALVICRAALKAVAG